MVSWSGFGHNGNCSITTGTRATLATSSPASVPAAVTASPVLSVGATVTTTVNGQTLTGVVFSASGEAISTASGTANAGAQNGGLATREKTRYIQFGVTMMTALLVFWL